MGAGGDAPELLYTGALRTSEDPSLDPAVWDVVVVGAGVAGSALAHALGRDGRTVLLLERDLAVPDRIVGELLQPGGYRKLKELGLEDCVEGIDSQSVHGYVMIKEGKEANVCYKDEAGEAAAAEAAEVEPVAGRSFHNGRFVQRLRQKASQCENVSLRQATVKRLLDKEGKTWADGQVLGGVAYKRPNEEQERIARAHMTVVCDGMYSSFRKHLSTPTIKLPSYFVGVILRGVRLPVPNRAVVVLGDPSPTLFYPISSDEVRCLVDIPGEKLPSVKSGEMAEHLRTVVAPQVPECLRGAFLEAVEEGGFRSMQNKSMSAQPLHRPGALLLGDSFNMRHPLTGGGMTVALHDTKLLCDMLRNPLDLSDPIATAKQTSEYYTRRKPWSATINTLANALYSVFVPTGAEWHEEMRQACFDYLRLGGKYSDGPISLLGGLNPSPFVLVAHFCLVAVYGVGRTLLPVPTPRALFNAVRLLIGAAGIILPIIIAEGPRQVFFPKTVKAPKPIYREA